MLRYFIDQARQSMKDDPEKFRQKAIKLSIGIGVTVLLIVACINVASVLTVSPFEITEFQWVA